jgi:hypothetical protein
LSHENKLLAENRANRPEKIQEIMKKNFKKKPGDPISPSPPSSSTTTTTPENINSISKGPCPPTVSAAAASLGITQPTLAQASLLRNAENESSFQGPLQKLMPRQEFIAFY